MQFPDVFLFDLDGTLIDSVPDLTEAVNRMLCDEGFGNCLESQVRNWVGDGSRILVERALRSALNQKPDDDLLENCYQTFHQHYSDCCTEKTVVFDHATELLNWVRSRGARTAIVTNKPDHHAQVLLEHWSKELPVDAVVGERRGRIRKPDPQMLAEAMEACNAATSWMVGDSDVDSAAAVAAGSAFIGVRLGYNHGRDIAQVVPAPLAVFDDLGDLLIWLQRTFRP